MAGSQPADKKQQVKKRKFMSFAETGLDPKLVSGCESMGYKAPTPIQRMAIPLILTGEDLIGCAETGTGKTAAFLLPLFDRLLKVPRPGVRVLVIAPTRELALQIEAVAGKLSPSRSLRVVSLVGGMSMEKQLQGLRTPPAIVIATPGRLLDHLERRSLDISRVESLVLDEADRMLDMGFWPDISEVLGMLPEKRQTLLFSATFSPEIERVARTTMRHPKLAEVSQRGKAAATVEQKAYVVASESKTAMLLHLLERGSQARVLIFTRTRRNAERLAHILQARGHNVERLHADRTQGQRQSALQGFRQGKYRILVATDIAARGIDVESITHVINYDVPEAPEDYVHRIGRTGRAGKVGTAITLVSPIDELLMSAIEKLTGDPIKRILLPGFGGINVNQVRSRNSGVRSTR